MVGELAWRYTQNSSDPALATTFRRDTDTSFCLSEHRAFDR